jgi:hypothetical protein
MKGDQGGGKPTFTVANDGNFGHSFLSNLILRSLGGGLD